MAYRPPDYMRTSSAEVYRRGEGQSPGKADEMKRQAYCVEVKAHVLQTAESKEKGQITKPEVLYPGISKGYEFTDGGESADDILDLPAVRKLRDEHVPKLKPSDCTVVFPFAKE